MAGRLPAALLIAVMAAPPVHGQEAAEPAQAIEAAPSKLRAETTGSRRPAVPPDTRLHSGFVASSTESPVRRFENVFLISLPFTALGSMALANR